MADETVEGFQYAANSYKRLNMAIRRFDGVTRTRVANVLAGQMGSSYKTVGRHIFDEQKGLNSEAVRIIEDEFDIVISVRDHIAQVEGHWYLESEDIAELHSPQTEGLCRYEAKLEFNQCNDLVEGKGEQSILDLRSGKRLADKTRLEIEGVAFDNKHVRVNYHALSSDGKKSFGVGILTAHEKLKQFSGFLTGIAGFQEISTWPGLVVAKVKLTPDRNVKNKTTQAEALDAEE